MAFPTNPIYKLLKNERDNIIGVKTIKNSLVYSIPINSDNTDYQEYLEWVAEGNTAEAAD
jgi:hypothetical protein